MSTRKAFALGGVTVLASTVLALALPAAGQRPVDPDPYAPSYLATTAETPARWAILDNGVKWTPGTTNPYVVCVLNTPTGRTTRTVPIPATVWRTASPITWTPGANCPG
jgi:hypothetical protein